MLEIQGFTPSNAVAPEVYVTSVEIAKSDTTPVLKIYYRLYDSRDPATGKMYWSDDEAVLQSLKVNINYEETGSVNLSSSMSSAVSLKSLKAVTAGVYDGLQTFKYTETSSSYITAYCSSDISRGISSREQILDNGKLVTTGSYLTKTKDLRLLLADLDANSKAAVSGSQILLDDMLYVSYTTDKKCKLAVVFDLNSYLLKKSENYKLLSVYEPYRKYILETSTVNLNKSQVFLTDITKRDGAETSYPFTSQNYKIEDKDSKYVLTFELKDLPAHEFFIKLKLDIFDNSTTFFNDNVLFRLETFKSLIQTYKNTLIEYGKNKNIKNINQYYFKNVYDTKVSYLARNAAVATDSELYKVYADAALEIAELTYIFNNSDIEDRLKLYTSVLHPLTTSPELLSGLVDHINNLYRACHKFSLIDSNTLSKKAKDDKNKYEKTFGNYGHPVINMTYDAGFGYEVINTDSYEARVTDTNTGLYKIRENQLVVRKTQEASKYFSSPNTATRRDISTFSLSMLDIGDYRYNFADATFLTPANTNEAYVYLKETYRSNKGRLSTEEVDYSFTYNYGKIGTIVYDLSSTGVSIENISNRRNGSNNNLQVNTLFDPINSTKDLSLKYITDTGVQKLYFLLDDIKYTEFTASDNSPQANAARGNTQELSKFVITDVIRADSELKAKQIFTYDCIYKNNVIITGSNYTLYELKEPKKNEVFGGLRSFNDYYLVESKLPSYVKVIKSSYNLLPDFTKNTPCEVLLRNKTTGPQVAAADI
jgi:hypothetical protein